MEYGNRVTCESDVTRVTREGSRSPARGPCRLPAEERTALGQAGGGRARPEDGVGGRGQQMRVCCAEGGGRGWAHAALERVDGELEGEPAGDGVGEAASVVSVDGGQGRGAGQCARREVDGRALGGEAAEVG